ncbi:MAG: glycosyltransferase [Candidatus Nanoarchaeia archaeon]
MEKISIVIPAYNEEKRIGSTLKEYFDYFKKIKKKKIIDFDIIVVLNACKDNTLGVVKKYKCKELKILNFERGGKCFAVCEGFKAAIKEKSDYIGFVDADGATPAASFYDLYANINGYDGVIANRWDKKSIISTKQTILRRIVSRGFNFLARTLFLFNYQDTQCGAKLFRRELLEKIVPKLGASEWSFDIDMLFYARRNNAKIKSIATEWNDKKESKVNLKKTPFRMFFSILRLRIYHSPFKFLLRVHSKLPRKMQVGYWFG